MELNIISLNINGGRSTFRKVQILQAIEKAKADILLQETHAMNTQVADWAKLFKGRWWLSGFPPPRASVAICLSHRLCAHQVSFKEIYKGHLISVEFLYNTQKLVILNVYAPSDPMERKIFFSTLRDEVKTLDATSFICIAGDFNYNLSFN